ncbi:LysM peptidoglycan-binding domain-containing protein [Winogradskyella sp. SYSU M77433]|uniref:LysM peptidoglycan-binding domain-containing protein n=1 Tax=Winogradskyella sp. SYSU M77433 TaxID=3042722 RepID=UPI0024818503|nr:LysM peptidoglycan-binding domain-containing protein [Winogradskyella sp. SYSU M77433]MDH7912691.1 LysM peptidoglycan-binding domain-containing protein [Winogradskyella sp. SYSU M77433]
MLKSCKTILGLLFLLTLNHFAFGQADGKYRDVILDGKPAKLNIVTGEITLMKSEATKAEENKDNTSPDPILVTDNTVITSSVKSQDNIPIYHIVKPDETLLDVSRKYNVTLAELKQANNLQTTLVDEGQKLLVKNFDLVDKNSSNLDADSKETASNYHVVVKGETLYSLAKRYNLSLEELKQQNNLSSNLIKVGQKLKVRNFDDSNSEKLYHYTVAKGDTLYSIANKNGVTVEALKELNRLSSNLIKVGQKLQLRSKE